MSVCEYDYMTNLRAEVFWRYIYIAFLRPSSGTWRNPDETSVLAVAPQVGVDEESYEHH